MLFFNKHVNKCRSRQLLVSHDDCTRYDSPCTNERLHNLQERQDLDLSIMTNKTHVDIIT